MLQYEMDVCRARWGSFAWQALVVGGHDINALLAALAEERCVVHKLAVREIPHSGKPKELLDRYGISASHIITAVKAALA